MAQRGASDFCPGDQNDSGWNGDHLIQPLAPKRPTLRLLRVCLSPRCLTRWASHHLSGQPVPVLSHPLGDSPFPPVQLVLCLLALIFFHEHLWEEPSFGRSEYKTSSRRKQRTVTSSYFVCQCDISVSYLTGITHQAEVQRHSDLTTMLVFSVWNSKVFENFYLSPQCSFLCVHYGEPFVVVSPFICLSLGSSSFDLPCNILRF